MINHGPSAQAETAYDHLDDQGQYTTAEIREKTGHETDGSNDDFTADAITVRVGGELALRSLGEAFSAENQKGGLDHSAWANQSPAQKAINHTGLELVRKANSQQRHGKE